MYHLRELQSTEYKMAEDALESALKILELNAEGKHGDYIVNMIDLPEVEGYSGLAFAIPDLIGGWKGRMRELLMDSAC
jgi:hypothetical protein